jgi:tRNA pseudouridine13 synthase
MVMMESCKGLAKTHLPACTSSGKTSPRRISQLESLRNSPFPHYHIATSRTCAIMSEQLDESMRPTKRARIDDNATPSLSAASSTPTQQTAAILSAPATIDADLEREVRAGITEYVCPDNLGFTGVLKQRYTDFLVNEIALDGQVLHLKSTEVEEKKKVVKENVQATNGAGKDKPESTTTTEVKVDAVMQDAGVAGETTLAVPEPAKVEDAPKEAEKDGEQIIGEPPAAKEEPEEEVRVL